MTIGKRMRINHPGHSHDGRCGILELVRGDTGWLLCGEGLVAAPVSGLTDVNVLQAVPERLATVEPFVRVFDVYQGAAV